MQISLSDTGKRFNREWVFRKITYQFIPGHSYAITGANGSGKSTLLQVIAGAIATSEGEINYELQAKKVDPENVFRHLSIAAPYQELIEEMDLVEFLQFHQQFKPLLRGLEISRVIGIIGLEKSAKRQIRYFSSGMKQRVKLAQAFFSDTTCVLLDEPCTNLDEEGIGMYHGLIRDYLGDRLVIVCSNDRQEYGFCREVLEMGRFKV